VILFKQARGITTCLIPSLVMRDSAYLTPLHIYRQSGTARFVVQYIMLCIRYFTHCV